MSHKEIGRVPRVAPALKLWMGTSLPLSSTRKSLLLQTGEERFGIHILLCSRGNDVDENRGRGRLGRHRSKRSNDAKRRGDGQKQGRFFEESGIHRGGL